MGEVSARCCFNKVSLEVKKGRLCTDSGGMNVNDYVAANGGEKESREVTVGLRFHGCVVTCGGYIRQPTRWHWAILTLANILMASNYYNSDMPAAIGQPLRDWLGSDPNLFQWQLSCLYSANSLPNIFLPALSGPIVDRVGTAKMLVLFIAVVAVGQVTFAMGMNMRSFPTLVAGRLLFGVGSESLEITLAVVLTDWFGAHGLAFALSLNLASARVLTALNDNVSPAVAAWLGSPVGAAWVGVGVCFASVCAGVALIRVDVDAVRSAAGVVLARRLPAVEAEFAPLLGDTTADERVRRDEFVHEIFEDAGPESDEPLVSSISTPVVSTSTGLRIVIDGGGGYESEEFDTENETQNWSELASLGTEFWILACITICLYGL
ncbi:hypothetical protein HDU82_000683 [Entophlyctis luteolus]|nr:hypothetical protein HDU82_000683 [Entophlyctis luteolus]